MYFGKIKSAVKLVKSFELLLFSMARAEFTLSDKKDQQIISIFRENLSANLKTFLS